MTNLKNKVAIITGSSRGIGKSIAMKLADNGAAVVKIGSTRLNS
ncbi:MAG: SDR family NAD(P)-dependent oxidoreductase, partial [Cyanobacteria bacterium J06641_2]